MKTLQELYNEVINSEELKKEFTQAAKNGKPFDFIRDHGVDVTPEEVKFFFEELAKKDKELSPDELDNTAGGKCSSAQKVELGFSICTVMVGCFFDIWISVGGEMISDKANFGGKEEGNGRLCNIEI